MPADLDARIAGVASLAEPQRRALYRFVVSRGDAVSKDEAAEALGVARSVAGFHLDRLVADGLLTTEFRRLTGRQGPGAGRPAKLYRRAADELSVSLPARQYDVAAALLAGAISDAIRSGRPAQDALRDTATSRWPRAWCHGPTGGRDAGEPARPPRGRTRRARGQRLRTASRGGEIVLTNCPFHALVDEQRELVCGMNLDLLSGMAEALGDDVLTARLEPSDDACCVRLDVSRRQRKGR